MKNTYLCLLAAFSLLPHTAVLAQGASSLNRDQIIARQLDCAGKNQNSIGWNDLCALDSYGQPVQPSTYRNTQLAAATQALDTYSQPVNTSAPAVTRKKMTYNEFLSGTPFTKVDLGTRKVHTFDMDTEVYYYRYEEPDIDIKITGLMQGYNANYAYRPQDNILNNAIFNTYMLQGRYASGELNYKGSGLMKDKDNSVWEFRGLLGKDYLIDDNALITPYLGFGFRYLLDKGNGRVSSDGHLGYDRHSHYWYLPVGISARIPKGAWTTDINVEYAFLLHGLQVSDFGSASIPGFDNPNVNNAQDKGFGLQASTKFTYVKPGLNFYIKPFIRYWNIEDSDVKSAVVLNSLGNWYEPQNTTFEAGSAFGLEF